MIPSPEGRTCRFVGDRVLFEVKDARGKPPKKGWRALLRTNLGRAAALRDETLLAHAKGVPFAGNSWRDIPMEQTAEGWRLDLALPEPGYFKAKAYLLDPRGWQHWPEGPDSGIPVHPGACRSANTIYCAFPRMFGGRRDEFDAPKSVEKSIQALDQDGYAVIPPSGKLRDLTRELPHIVERLGCRILHLLPVSPTPSTYARFGRFGSPYAALDPAAIDPALVVFDKRTTGVDQFCELTYTAHSLGARVILDMVVNHTGWGSVLQESHPEWFLRKPDGEFKSPGAWGTTWEDLVELKHTNVALWDELSEVFLTWCRRGVDGFRCDAGYMVPMPAWQYIIASVQQEYPNTVFLLEGLGGAWELTEALLTEGGMQWAYSELFQNYSGPQVARYLDHSIAKSGDTGLLVHYSETHDNDRLAARGRSWSLLRNRLCALASGNGGFGFTCGVEWLASEKIRVHGNVPMNWGAKDNIVDELARLNTLLSTHPCFFDGAKVERISAADSPVLALLRRSQDGRDTLLVLANTDVENTRGVLLSNPAVAPLFKGFANGTTKLKELLGQKMPGITQSLEGLKVNLDPGEVCCLGWDPSGLAGEAYRAARARAAWAVEALSRKLALEQIGPMPWQELSNLVDADPVRFLGAVQALDPEAARADLAQAFANVRPGYLPVVEWTLSDASRITPAPPGHWVLVRDAVPFRIRLSRTGSRPLNLQSTPLSGGHVAAIAPTGEAGDATLAVERYAPSARHISAALRFLPQQPLLQKTWREPSAEDLALLTNGRGGMVRMALDLGKVNSKYDCVLGANLHPDLPVDRHVFVKRIRVWVNADGFLSQLNAQTLDAFEAGPPATWRFLAPAGDGRSVEIEMRAAMIPDRNTVVFRFSRPTAARAAGKQLPAKCDVRLTIRLDVEDRGFHSETHRNAGAEHHFSANTRAIPDGKTSGTHGAACEWRGFEFAPAKDRQLRVFTDAGCYHPQAEWSEGIAHPLEESRGQVSNGDAYSPGWFELALPKGGAGVIVATAEAQLPNPKEIEDALAASPPLAAESGSDFARVLASAVEAFVVRRGPGRTVIAGYPWFLDWGRDTFIAARGLITAGRHKDVSEIVRTFARFERDGTLPNTIFGEDASNRDTSDAPLWFGVVCEELEAAAPNLEILSQIPDGSNRTVREVLESIAEHYVRGTPNGIRMDAASGLIWSPAHFTWMDTNHPAGTPREGYPVEIQALWIRLLRFLGAQGSASRRSEWNSLAARAAQSVEQLFWLEDKLWYADVLLAPGGGLASQAVKDDALRSNACFLVSLGISTGERAQSTVAAVSRFLLVPGALRSLAPLPVRVPLRIRSSSGHPLNDPHAPYWGHYEGDEDTRRKPAYHNGTAWVWTMPGFCEALARAWDFSPEAVSAARAYLGSTEKMLQEGCLGHLPEILDGDAPHRQRGCDAQAWSVTETLRVWQLLGKQIEAGG